MAQAIDLALGDDGDNRLSALTRREREVTRLLAAAMTNKQIAETLVIAVPTAERHVTNILHKLQLSSRAQVVRWALETSDGSAP